jgi:hypothetical protein
LFAKPQFLYDNYHFNINNLGLLLNNEKLVYHEKFYPSKI